MAKRSATRNRPRPADQVGTVGPRQPCPCGSGKRYKACHGAVGGAADAIVLRPFEGLAAECELVALREFVPSATAPLPLRDSVVANAGGRDLMLATVLPMVAAALVRADGTGMIGLQVQTRSGDLSRDLARAAQWALTAEPGSVLPAVGHDTGGDAARLQDLIDADARLRITMHEDFSWWLDDDESPTGEAALSLERANDAIHPTERIDAEGVEAAYWVDARGKAHLRWVRPEPEEQLLAALARLATGGELDLGSGSRYAGSFRAHGLLVPVWDLDTEQHAREWAEPAAAFATRLTAALSSLDPSDGKPLTDAERRTLLGLRGRQITIR